jgi:hypothetical protein
MGLAEATAAVITQWLNNTLAGSSIQQKHTPGSSLSQCELVDDTLPYSLEQGLHLPHPLSADPHGWTAIQQSLQLRGATCSSSSSSATSMVGFTEGATALIAGWLQKMGDCTHLPSHG